MKGTLKAFGSNGNAQLAIGNEEDTYFPTRCIGLPQSFSSPPKCIVAGGNHTLVLFPNGRLFAAGLNSYGQCGISTASKFPTFQEVPTPPDEDSWDLVSAGWDFSVLATSQGEIYVCGFGSKGELGLGEEVTTATELRRIPRFSQERIVQITSGLAHTLVVLANGEVWGWGAARKGQLGAVSKVLPTPQRVPVEFPVARAACGREFSFLIDAEGERHCLLGGNGRFGLLDQMPRQGQLRDWKSMGAAWGSVLVLMQDGEVIAWGRNDRGQLPPIGLKGVRELAVGSEHAAAIVDGKLVCWGWGEHGNCGKDPSQGAGDVKGEIFTVGIGAGTLAGIGAGCATSWAWVQEEGD
jgi:protein ATS1